MFYNVFSIIYQNESDPMVDTHLLVEGFGKNKGDKFEQNVALFQK